jgi:hypothetical protein
MVRDFIKAVASKELCDKLGDRLRAAKGGVQISNPVPAVQVLAKETGLLESEADAVLENLIADADYSRYGASNAVTKVANRDEVTVERAMELEEIGGKVLDLNAAQWQRIASAVKVEKAAVRIAA